MQLLSWSRCALGVALLGGCTFAPAGGSATDGSVPPGDGAAIDASAGDGPIAGDARPPDAAIPTDALAPPDLPYLEAANEQPGTGDWIIDQDVSFSTDLNPASPGIDLPPGVTFTLQPQTVANSRTILVLHVRRLELQAGTFMYLYGSRPLAIVAGQAVVVDGAIDASAWFNSNSGVRSPGPGGFSGNDVAGAGGGGTAITAAGGASDSGAGGGGHGTVGGRGGGDGCVNDVCTVAPGPGGTAINAELFYLGGGGRGGAAANRMSCIARSGGAGGGGLLVYSPVSIAIGASGEIESNGGGGGGGRVCQGVGTLAGSGGGAGGQIELQSPAVTIAAGGLVVANGGSGGGGGSNTTSQVEGSSGEDGADSLTVATPGGDSGAVSAGDGGAGSIGSGPGGNGSDVAVGSNGGGAGGGAGRIIVRYRGVMPAVTTSPPASFAPY